ncbi:MAG: dTDP-glucose 4,6-dehydratase [FCB group bacterium]|nr:dTDP-glucose 4,6-dehydratase [FCB group bacterium]
MKLLLTGTAGFIGSSLVAHLLRVDSDLELISLDSLDYAGNRINLDSIQGGIESDRHRFVHGSICDRELVNEIVGEGIDGIINLAAHTHVDRAYYRPESFIRNNVEGVLNLLRAAAQYGVPRFLQVSTDEVYGAVKADAPCDEMAPLRPGNYYSSSKASADLYISAASNYGEVDAVIIRGTNNFGPRQFPEKLIPFFTGRILTGQNLPLYGDGKQMRDWLYVEDFCRAIWLVFTKGARGEIYNAGAGNHMSNYDLTRRLIAILDADPVLIKCVADRPGHDFCYAVDWGKIEKLGWRPKADFENALADTVCWYRDNPEWCETILKESTDSDSDTGFFDRHYRDRN